MVYYTVTRNFSSHWGREECIGNVKLLIALNEQNICITHDDIVFFIRELYIVKAECYA
jgi:hypothetical protein